MINTGPRTPLNVDSECAYLFSSCECDEGTMCRIDVALPRPRHKEMSDQLWAEIKDKPGRNILSANAYISNEESQDIGREDMLLMCGLRAALDSIIKKYEEGIPDHFLYLSEYIKAETEKLRDRAARLFDEQSEESDFDKH